MPPVHGRPPVHGKPTEDIQWTFIDKMAPEGLL